METGHKILEQVFSIISQNINNYFDSKNFLK